MGKPIKIIVSLLVCVVSFGLVGFNGGSAIPGTGAAGCMPRYSRTPGRTLTVDSQNRVHLVYASDLENDALSAIYTQDWLNWSSPQVLSIGPAYNAAIAADSSGTVYAGYNQFQDGLYLVKSEDGGQTWGESQLIFPYVEDEVEPGRFYLAWGNGSLHLVWLDIRYGANSNVYTVTSDDMGATWSTERAIRADTTTRSSPVAVNCRGSELVATWCEVFDLLNEEDRRRILMLRSSQDGGQTWGEYRYPAGPDTFYDTSLTRPPFNVVDVEISQDAYYVLWDSAGSYFVASSGNQGQTWDRTTLHEPSSDTALVLAEIAERDGLVAALICDEGSTYLKYSTDGGETWSEPALLGQADDPGTWDPNLIIDAENRVHAVWSQAVDSLTSVLYYWWGIPGIGVAEQPPEIHPALNAFPNPFSNHVSLHIGLDAEHEIEPVIYDAAGRMVASLGTLSKGQGLAIIDWDGRDERGRRIPRGSYFLRVGKGDEEHSLKIVKVK